MQRAALQRQLEDGIADLGLALPPGASARLIDYIELLARWNAAYNLTAVRDPGQMVTRHLLDSLAIAAPARRVTLIDTNGKKCRFQREAVRSLGLDNVEVIHGRVEDAHGTYDCITARAFASLADMLGWGGHLLAAHGCWLAMKGRHPDEELAALPARFRLESEHPLQVPGLDAERHLLVLARSGAA